MRAFFFALLLGAVIAVGAAAILDNFVQETATTAFAEPSARVQRIGAASNLVGISPTYVSGIGDAS